jgi:hypothetical protein
MNSTTPPWGVGKPPALHCHDCQKPIPAKRQHYLFEGSLLLCEGCIYPGADWMRSSRPTHAKHYPTCTRQWHDMWDHLDCTADRYCASFIVNNLMPPGRRGEQARIRGVFDRVAATEGTVP